MNARSLRRLAADHASLHNAGLPPNYLFPSPEPSGDDLTQLDVLLAGPESTPYASGLFKLHLDMPPNYPTAPPTATFRTRIWHPNVDESSGAICVDTLKRDWNNSLTLRHVLVTINCLLIEPNPASALNGEAGRLMEEDYAAFGKRARMMCGVHAACPPEWAERAEDARRRGDEDPQNAKEKLKSGPARPSRRLNAVAGTTSQGKGAGRGSEENSQAIVSAEPVPDDPLDVSTSANSSKLKTIPNPAGSIPTTHSASSIHNIPEGRSSVRARKATSSRRRTSHATVSSTSGTPSLIDWKVGLEKERTPERQNRYRVEKRRMRAARNNVRDYNRGTFGPRFGLDRL
ncbi:hypothetical protein P152DRAFT_265292 [Eremomyces bilateralis CBS 781.70]|uniref:UBC core domain-containing protein n=1 Tax=Eremomyces bilateralis CBS 781.70 TaxID=1392243 RepID=A0A6G1G844_9PEZI|nr:uncharacterized protein P152DRAFT_265292 [Eremomyces bilateralis CBS 781.70]KAF1814237.1 hypothetical protein P152DRAFT_265292 [Eremomyces bilateralis CBS 781.70]